MLLPVPVLPVVVPGGPLPVPSTDFQLPATIDTDFRPVPVLRPTLLITIVNFHEVKHYAVFYIQMCATIIYNLLFLPEYN